MDVGTKFGWELETVHEYRLPYLKTLHTAIGFGVLPTTINELGLRLRMPVNCGLGRFPPGLRVLRLFIERSSSFSREQLSELVR